MLQPYVLKSSSNSVLLVANSMSFDIIKINCRNQYWKTNAEITYYIDNLVLEKSVLRYTFDIQNPIFLSIYRDKRM